MAWLSSPSGHVRLTPCLAVGWCTWADCVFLQQESPGISLAKAGEQKGFSLGNVCSISLIKASHMFGPQAMVGVDRTPHPEWQDLKVTSHSGFPESEGFPRVLKLGQSWENWGALVTLLVLYRTRTQM